MSVANITRGPCTYERLRTDANEGNLPCEDEADDGATYDGDDGLNDAKIPC